MNWSIPLLRVRGIEIKVHLTFVLILVWAAYYWGADADNLAQGALYGIVATLLLFACVTLHELGHAVAAQRYGIAVQDVTLLPIGGVARIEVPQNPRQELWIALAGPAVNVVIAAVLIATGAVLEATSLAMPADLSDTMRDAEWNGLLAYLTLANIGLVLFNAIPAFPLDGGRVFRALLALRTDYRQATRIAVSVGQGLAFLLGLGGFVTGDIFLIVIAIFVWFGASAEGQQVAVDDVLGGATVGQTMIRQPQVLAATDPLTRAVELTLSTAQSDFPVVEPGGKVVGMLTLDDLLRGLRDQPVATVGAAMRRDFPVGHLDEAVTVAQGQLGNGRVRALPVVQPDGRLAGLLTAADIGEAFRLLIAQPKLGAGAASVVPWSPKSRAGAVLDSDPGEGRGWPAVTSFPARCPTQPRRATTMNILDRFFGHRNELASGAREPITARPLSAEPLSDEQAVERYRYLLRTAPPETIEAVHAEAFAQLSPEQRRMVLESLNGDQPSQQHEGRDDPRSLARLATRAELRRPGTLERTFGGIDPRGAGGGGLLGGNFLNTVAAVVVGTAVVDALFADGTYPEGYQDGAEAAGAGQGTDAADAGYDAGDIGHDSGGGIGDGDIGGGDF